MSSSNKDNMRPIKPKKPQARHYQKQEPKQNQNKAQPQKHRDAAPSSNAHKTASAFDAHRSKPTSANASKPAAKAKIKPAPASVKAAPKPQYPSDEQKQPNRAVVRKSPIDPSKVRTVPMKAVSVKKTSAQTVINALAVIIAAAAVIIVTTLILTTVFSTVEFKELPEPAEYEKTAQQKAVFGDMSFAAPTDSEGHVIMKAAATESDEKPPVYQEDDIPAITGLERVSESADGIVLKWDDIPGVNGFRVYWQDLTAEDPSYHLFTTIPCAGLDIRNLSTGCKYGFKIAAYIKQGGSVYEGEAAEVSFSTIPASVENFRLTDATKTTTTMAWDKNDRADGYVLERCASGEWSEYQTFDADTTEFTDEDLKSGKAYYYRLCSYREDSTGKLKGESAVIYTVAGLLGPEDDGSASKLGRVSLDYEESDYADGYKICYSKDKEDWEELTDTTDTHYSTSRLEDGETYWFRIYPYREVDSYIITGTYTELEFVAEKVIYDREVGDTYVEVSLDDQHMWYIVDGDVYLESDCVTGNYGSADTPKGYFEVNGKASPCTLKGDDYVSHVTYWMPFIGGGWGLHDADWRSSFGGNIYKGNGSHGCVNLPPKIAKEMYAHIEVGTPVIVY